MENGETQAWLDVAFASKYISRSEFDNLDGKCEEISNF